MLRLVELTPGRSSTPFGYIEILDRRREQAGLALTTLRCANQAGAWQFLPATAPPSTAVCSNTVVVRVVLPFSLLLVSCTSTIRPTASFADPSTVLLLTHGISSSLVLADEKGRAVRFAYGDWRYYALSRTGTCDAIAAILWPTPSAIGRQVIDDAAQEPSVLIRQIAVAHDGVFLISAEREAVARLRRDLEALFLAGMETRVYNPEAKLEFVRHPESYSLFNNSNEKVAEWLRALGAGVSGWPVLPHWRVE